MPPGSMVVVQFMFELVSCMDQKKQFVWFDQVMQKRYAAGRHWRSSFVKQTLGAKAPAKIQEVTLMRPIHGNL